MCCPWPLDWPDECDALIDVHLSEVSLTSPMKNSEEFKIVKPGCFFDISNIDTSIKHPTRCLWIVVRRHKSGVPEYRGMICNRNMMFTELAHHQFKKFLPNWLTKKLPKRAIPIGELIIVYRRNNSGSPRQMILPLKNFSNSGFGRKRNALSLQYGTKTDQMELLYDMVPSVEVYEHGPTVCDSLTDEELSLAEVEVKKYFEYYPTLVKIDETKEISEQPAKKRARLVVKESSGKVNRESNDVLQLSERFPTFQMPNIENDKVYDIIELLNEKEVKDH